MKILIIGAGKMGSWLADELCIKHEIAVYDTNPLKLKYLFKTERFTEKEMIRNFDPEICINAVAIQDTIKVFEEITPYLSKNCIISDLCSVKNGVSEYYQKCSFRFVSTHPMFGPTFAQMGHLTSQHAIIISESDEMGKFFFKKLYAQFELNIHEMSFEEHDETIAYSLAIPFSSTLAFSSCLIKQNAPGTTFQKHFEIAKGLLSEDNYLLSEILLAEKSLKKIEQIRDSLSLLVDLIQEKDVKKVHEFIQSSRDKIQNQKEFSDKHYTTLVNCFTGF